MLARELPICGAMRLFSRPESSALLRWVCFVQGTYYLLTGVWPLISLRSFEVVTGPKRDGWLVKTVGALVTVVGGALLMAARRAATDAPRAELVTLAMGSAAALGTVDVVYASSGRIASIYLLDAVAEAVLLAGWAMGLLGRRNYRSTIL